MPRHQAKKKNKEKVQRLARHGEQRRVERRAIPESFKDNSPPTRNGEQKVSRGSEHQRSLTPNSQRRVKGEEARNGEWKGEPMARRSREQRFKVLHGKQYTREAS